MHTISGKKLLMLKPEEIKKSALSPRKSFDEYEMKLLAESIASSGIIEPLAVRKNEDGKYELIAGKRRLKAAVMAGLRRVPCVLHKTDEATAALYAVIENLQRCSLTVFEEAEALQKLIIEHNLSQIEIASRLGIAQSTLSNKLRLLRLSEEVKEKITLARLTERHARALLRLPSFKREEALDFIIAEDLTLKETEEYIEELLNPKIEEKPKMEEKPVRKAVIGDVRLFSNSLSKLVDTLKTAGIEASSRRNETDKYIEYKVRIKKEPSIPSTQLKIC